MAHAKPGSQAAISPRQTQDMWYVTAPTASVWSIALSWEPNSYLLRDCLIFLHPRICVYFRGCVNHNPLFALTSNSLALLLSCHFLPYHISISNYHVERQFRLATVQVSDWSAQLRDYDSHNHENRHQILGGRKNRKRLGLSLMVMVMGGCHSGLKFFNCSTDTPLWNGPQVWFQLPV